MSENQNSKLAFNDAGYSELEESIRRLSLTAEDQFESIKHEKWYLRLWDMVTFSRKGEKRLAEQISTLSQAQQILAQYLLKASQQDKDISDLVKKNTSYIEKLAGQSISFKKELTSVSNLMLLLNEINNGLYNGIKPITAMCLILSQLDNEVLDNRRALTNILLSLNNHNVLNGKNIEIIDFLIDVADISEKEMPIVYTELSSIRSDYYAALVLSLIETLFFSNDNVPSRDDAVLNVAITHNIEKKYDNTTLNTVFVSLLNSIIALKVDEGSFSITNPSAKKEREEAEKLFYEGKLIEAYPKFIHAADSGDARACYFAARYYFVGYGKTGKSEEIYKKYLDLGIRRREPFCYLEKSKYLYSQGDKKKAEYWRNKILKQVGTLADKGDAVACYLIAQTALDSFLELYSVLEAKENKDWSEENKRKIGVFVGIYRNYSSKAVEAGYWPAAISKCFSLATILDGENRENNLEKYGWLFENVEWANIQRTLGGNYIAMDRTDNRYYKKAADCFLKAYRLQKDDSLSGYISFFLNAGVINESKIDGIEKRNIKILYYKGLDSNEPASLQGLGDLYYWGVGDEHLGMNKTSAFEHYEKAYETYDNVGDFPGKKTFDMGKARIAYMLGYMTFNGVGTIQDTEKAVLYYQDAVQRGEKMAIKPLANCYLNGIGVNKDINRYDELMSMIENE